MSVLPVPLAVSGQNPDTGRENSLLNLLPGCIIHKSHLMEMPSCGAAVASRRDRMPQRLLGRGPSPLDLVGADICSHAGVRATNRRWIIFLGGFAHRDHNFYPRFEFTGRWSALDRREAKNAHLLGGRLVVFSSRFPLFFFFLLL